MSTKDGGPAFPILERGGNGLELTCVGMSLRDYFAAHVDMGDMDSYSQTTGEWLLGRPCPVANPETVKECLEWWAEYRSVLRFIEADAMIKAREEA